MRRESEGVFEPGELLARPPWAAGWTAAGVVSVLGPMVVDERRQRLESVIARRLGCVTALLDSPHDPHNGAAVMRSCDAFGVQELHVIPASERFLASNEVAQGTERWVDVIEHASAEQAVQALQRGGFELVTTHPSGELVPEQLSELARVALVFGNERSGIGSALSERVGRSVRIPMVGFVESLNVSVSAAILLRAATQGRPGDLSPAAREHLFARGLYHSVRRARDVLSALPPR